MRKFTLAALAVFFAVNLSAQNKMHSQRIYPGCSYGGDVHWSGSDGDVSVSCWGFSCGGK